MKKLIAVLSILATVLSLAACSVESGKTTAELVSEAEAEKSQLVESSIQAEVEYSEQVVKSVDKMGKTEKNKQLVIKRPYANGEHYQVFVLDRKGICKTVIDYYYYNSVELFENNNQKQKEKTSRKKIDSDPASRMVAFEREYDVEERNTFDQLYEFFSDESFKEAGYIIIE